MIRMVPFAGALALALACATPAFAQQTRVTGTIDATSILGGLGFSKIDFTCTGEPTCTGTYQAQQRDSGCSNTFSLANPITVMGLDLAQPGMLQLIVILKDFDFSDILNPDGTCSIRPGTFFDFALPLRAQWDGTTGTINETFDDPDGTFAIKGSFKADRQAPPPVFPMKVRGTIDNNVGNVVADIEFRPQDVGSNGSVYVFAVAPITVVKQLPGQKATHYGHMSRGGPKDTPVQCVLAQLSSSGQLVGVSASAMQAYLSGVLAAGQQTVTILNGVPTVNIGGATFYVGYGPSSAAMLNGGVNRSAITAPGAIQCKPEAPKTGWWWNTAEGGRGYSVEVRGNNIFFAAFHYDPSGRSLWHVATGPTSLDGSLFNGDLLLAQGGQTLGGGYPGRPRISSVGPLTLAFADNSHGTMVWPGGTVAIERFNIVPNGLVSPPKTDQPESGWWWNPDESGRGFFIEWQNGWADVAGYMYDDQGNPVWYLAVYATPEIRMFTGSWWSYANGQVMGGPYKPATRINDNVAPVTITFDGLDNATMTLPNGRTTRLTRHRF